MKLTLEEILELVKDSPEIYKRFQDKYENSKIKEKIKYIRLANQYHYLMSQRKLFILKIEKYNAKLNAVFEELEKLNNLRSKYNKTFSVKEKKDLWEIGNKLFNETKKILSTEEIKKFLNIL